MAPTETAASRAHMDLPSDQIFTSTEQQRCHRFGSKMRTVRQVIIPGFWPSASASPSEWEIETISGLPISRFAV